MWHIFHLNQWITESQAEAGRVLSRSSGPAKLHKQGHLETVPKGYVQVGFECLKSIAVDFPTSG